MKRKVGETVGATDRAWREEKGGLGGEDEEDDEGPAFAPGTVAKREGRLEVGEEDSRRRLRWRREERFPGTERSSWGIVGSMLIDWKAGEGGCGAG